ncbi:MAG: cytochrome c3 family protein [Gammaproteobacteria bacterium]|nr:cytochrome c3 family protein [Gammaproteobacteria bacterium]
MSNSASILRILNFLLVLLFSLIALGGCAERDFSSRHKNDSNGSSNLGGTEHYKVLAVNRRGMAFPDQDFSVFAIFPPANFIKAQVIKTSTDKKQLPVLLDNTEVKLEYQGTMDRYGSINTSSASKTNFWEHAGELYRFLLGNQVRIPLDGGVRGLLFDGQNMPGLNNIPQTFGLFDAKTKEFTAAWVPITPIDDNGNLNYFPQFQISAIVRGEHPRLLASTNIVLPMAKPMDCAHCHATGEIAANDAVSQRLGIDIEWSQNSDIDNQGKENVLLLHGATTGLDLLKRTPLMCAECHYSPVADPDGLGPSTFHQQRRLPLSISIHAAHALNNQYQLAVSNETQNIPEDGNTSCMYCHGREAPYVRDAMSKSGINCQSCHGGMLAVGKSPMVGSSEQRRPFLDEPRCESCHTGDALQHLGDSIVLNRTFDESDVFATQRLAVNRRYAEEPDKLYRQSVGHGGVACQGCHGSPHAIWSSSIPGMVDNLIPIQLQGHVGTISQCEVCHEKGVPVSLNGPHGLHNIDDPQWMGSEHGRFYNADPKSCQSCHGLSLEGTHLSRALAARSFITKAGSVIQYGSGQVIGCNDCHLLTR